MKEVFGQNGHLENFLPDFEVRDEQVEMSDFILERLYEGENGLIEAGTGTGKTFAYLISVLQFSLDHNKKVCITTETKALQKQIIDNDLPVVKDYFNKYSSIDFTFSLCLGGSNYPCLKRYKNVMSRGKVSKKDLERLEKVGTIIKKDRVVTRFDIKLPNRLWNEINREHDACRSFKCPENYRCVFQKARKEWEAADLLIMNHYLFFTNIATGKIYLPQSEIVIFDEAHSAEDIASSQLGFELSYDGLLDVLSKFYKERRRNNLTNSIQKESLRKKTTDLIKKIIVESGEYFDNLRSIVPSDQFILRLREPIKKNQRLIDLIESFMLLMIDAETELEDDDFIKMEFDIARGRLFLFLENLKLFIYQNNENYVYWIEKDRRKILDNIHLKGQPIDVFEIMRKEVIEFYESSFFVSATLSINKNFSFIENRLGLERHRSLSIESTFDYKNQMVLYLAKDIDDPIGELFMEQSSVISAEIIKYLKGNCLLLFTSYKMLDDLKNILEDMHKDPIYSQGELTSSEAVELYKKQEGSVLMGTHSFWQGIDLPGDQLRGVIMMKLPFSVPDSPPVQARMERLMENGRNPFVEYQVPEAVLKFKQGFGRLIRSKKDRGIVAILDTRIISKPYGKRFLKSIPECKIVYTLEELFQEYSLLK